ncbi:CPBP family intramembrane glutamic endopeptidase [Planctomicrobium sp. SH661]|uniref:CPBP family intramembrane glutamic endopeptidase n=1 Tax=Planctomicrobium sp. SH661 TaxID=3448124 RepID=UPI003F5B7199
MEQKSPADESPVEPVAERVPRSCRRCRNPFDAEQSRCPVCGASAESSSSAAGIAIDTNDVVDRGMLAVCYCYGAMLGISALYGVTRSTKIAETPTGRLISCGVTLAVFIGAALIAWRKTRNVPVPIEPLHSPLKAWTLLLPLLALALAANSGYHRVLKNDFHVPVTDNYVELLGSVTAAILMVCVAPALVEEFFFRSIAWKPTRNLMGSHATVLVTSAMFGMAHIGVPLSIPILFGVGLVLGYLRLWSGGLIAPMIAHFLHNLVVVLYPDF